MKILFLSSIIIIYLGFHNIPKFTISYLKFIKLGLRQLERILSRTNCKNYVVDYMKKTIYVSEGI